MPINTEHMAQVLEQTYQQELTGQHIPYLESHATQNVIRRQIDAAKLYVDLIKENDTILDWGCCHAPDSLLLKEMFGEKIKLFGCDFFPSNYTPVFHQKAGLTYATLQDNVKLPYEDSTFDMVIGSGVLEHTAFDYESMKEVYRVLKVDGLFVITFLPNYYSISEYITRNTVKCGFHNRLYQMTEIKRQLLHAGMIPIKSGYHQFIPGIKGQAFFSKLWWINGFLESTAPFKYFSSNLMVISRKVNAV